MSRRSGVLASSLVQLLNHALTKLQDLWDSIGIQEDMRVQRMESVNNYIENLLEQMIHEEEFMKGQLEESIENSQKELKILCSELERDPYEVDENITILQLEKELRNKLEILTKEKNVRLEECKSLQDEDQAICTDICKTPYYIPTGKVPSFQQVKELKEHIMYISKEKERRQDIFLGLKQKIIKLFEDLGCSPDTTLENDAVLETANLFYLSDGNIKALEVLLEQLKLRKEELLATQETLKKQMKLLWSLLQIPIEEQKDFVLPEQGSILDINRALEHEVERLEQVKAKNIKQVITGIRQELHNYWDKCFCSQKQKTSFAALSDDHFTEELLKEHDEELLKMSLYHQKYKNMFENVEKWEQKWKQFLELEKKASDRNRYANRGGTLLKEEKERNQLQRKLPKMEEELKVCIEKWEEEQGCPFLVNGKRFIDYIAEQWEQYRIKREKRQGPKESGVSSKPSLKRPLGGFSTPSNKIRRLDGASSVSGGSNVSSVHVGKPPLSGRKTPCVSKLPDLLQRPALQDHKQVKTHISVAPSPRTPQPLSTLNRLVTSYSEFSRDLNKKSSSEQLNSTTVENN
ncbi:protein regulator of cytokinesis 1-like [Callorhinchus milii]|uniref:Protein regulator of cytokinesis 1-like protein n=1 Tax=Callorhinchus milii TaxID=7868 RepID=K4FV71_CALMI|nr:protein regulator of cytokinesis 1-like [Callorhinchus milii]AFK11649.1 protein regulator of cytokinesis 1-like protein [Callorhinchus milii]|eukprot:gi/632978389/ref/XP_007905886.1/ PREDICTED: protein regulator of cytokinesis 1-like isoform X1 [Callorhinchus milii]